MAPGVASHGGEVTCRWKCLQMVPLHEVVGGAIVVGEALVVKGHALAARPREEQLLELDLPSAESAQEQQRQPRAVVGSQ